MCTKMVKTGHREFDHSSTLISYLKNEFLIIGPAINCPKSPLVSSPSAVLPSSLSTVLETWVICQCPFTSTRFASRVSMACIKFAKLGIFLVPSPQRLFITHL